MTTTEPSDSEVKRVEQTHKQRMTAVSIRYINEDTRSVYSKLDDLIESLDKFKAEYGDFGEIIPQARQAIETATGNLDDAIAEIERVVDLVT